ncbi:hypothetical protein [Paenibacillus amylolyticus]|uniref:Uncharacterized protein n=1 Tax=Paenibacillus amylolyticus TaxID=1451 RepID=A0ABD8B2U2_PAEAM
MKKEEGRKTRSDKKIAVAPYVSSEVYEMVSQVSYISDLPIKSVGERLFQEGIHSRVLLDHIKGLFRRNYQRTGEHMYVGDLTLSPYRPNFEGEKQRLHMRMLTSYHDRLTDLAYALDCSNQAAAGLVIETAVMRKDILYPFLGQIIVRELDTQRYNQLRSLSRFLDARSKDAYITTPVLMRYIVEQSLNDQQKLNKSLDQLGFGN